MANLTISFTPASPAPANGYLVQYRIAGTFGAYTVVSPNPTNSPVIIAGLSPGTEYEGIIQADCGGSNLGDNRYFLTCTCPVGYVKSSKGYFCEEPFSFPLNTTPCAGV